jgi:curved DNA-binding protein CbpA
VSDQLDDLDYYTLLGLARDATDADIKKAWRAFARRYHPDRHAREGDDKRARATQIYRRGSEGLQVLSDPEARKLYDRALEKGIRRLTAEQRDGASRKKDASKTKAHPIQSVEAQRYYDAAKALVQEGKLREAYKTLQRAFGIEPESVRIKMALDQLHEMIREG